MFIEDLVQRMVNGGRYIFAHKLQLMPKDHQLILSFSSQLDKGYGFSEKQADLAVKFCKKYKDQLDIAFGVDIQTHLDSPKFITPIRKVSAQTKSIEIVDSPDKLIKVTFPYDQKIVEKIRSWKEKSVPDAAVWDAESKSWMFTLTETSIDFIRTEFLPHGFSICENFDHFLKEIDQISQNFEDFVPRLASNGDSFSLVNTHPSIPALESNNLIESLFIAKQYGITCWDESIDETLKSGDFSPLTRKFLKSGSKSKIEVDSSKFDLEVFDDIIKYASPCLIIIPPGSEIIHLRKWWAYLNSHKFEKSQVSVMFRTENGSDKMFNELVRDYGLNNPIDENTKFVVVSQKLPKPVVKSGIRFNSVINLGSINGVHYTLSSFLQDFPDIILYNSKGAQGNSKWQTVQ